MTLCLDFLIPICMLQTSMNNYYAHRVMSWVILYGCRLLRMAMQFPTANVTLFISAISKAGLTIKSNA